MGDGLVYNVVCRLVAAVLMAHLAGVACDCISLGLKWLGLGITSMLQFEVFVAAGA